MTDLLPADLPVERETPDLVGSYPRLSEEQLDRLRAFGIESATSAEQVLVATGQRTASLLFILDGVVMTAEGPVRDPVDNHELPVDDGLHVGVHGRGRFIGDIGVLEGQPSFFTAIVIEPGRVLEIPIGALEGVAREDPVLGDIILRACLVRRSLVVGSGMRIVGSRHLPRTRQLLDFVARNRLPYRLIDLDRDSQAEEIVRRLGVPRRDVPIVILGHDLVLRRATPSNLALALGIRSPRRTAIADLVVIGGGPAGLAVAVNGASDGLSVVLCDSVAIGGQSATTSLIENYLGFPAGISGAELADRARLQARKFGAEVSVPSRARLVQQRAGELIVRIAGGDRLVARAVVVATVSAIAVSPCPASRGSSRAASSMPRPCMRPGCAAPGRSSSSEEAILRARPRSFSPSPGRRCVSWSSRSRSTGICPGTLSTGS